MIEPSRVDPGPRARGGSLATAMHNALVHGDQVTSCTDAFKHPPPTSIDLGKNIGVENIESDRKALKMDFGNY